MFPHLRPYIEVSNVIKAPKGHKALNVEKGFTLNTVTVFFSSLGGTST